MGVLMPVRKNPPFKVRVPLPAAVLAARISRPEVRVSPPEKPLVPERVKAGVERGLTELIGFIVTLPDPLIVPVSCIAALDVGDDPLRVKLTPLPILIGELIVSVTPEA